MIIKFDPNGRVLMVFGRKKEASDEARPLDARQSSAAAGRRPVPPADRRHLGPAGNIYISDGYINSRVAKFDKNGKWVKSCGTPGAGPANSTRRNRSPLTPRGTSTSPIGAIDAFRCSIPKATSARDHDRRAGSSGRHSMDGRHSQGQGVGAMGSGAPWAICITPGPGSNISIAQTRSRGESIS